MDTSIKLYLSYHKAGYIPSNELFCPIQVGSALAAERLPDVLHDDIGDNISSRNRSYCELTAQYWAWKNDSADYYGFFHYRRYLFFRGKRSAPYIICNQPDEKTLEKLAFDPKLMRDHIERYDVIAPLPENMHFSVYDQYKNTAYHFIEDLELVRHIIGDKYPDFIEATDEYLKGTDFYFCNMFIMKKEIFNHYCSWLFAILNEFDERTDFSKYQGKAVRVDGYLGERLFGIYYTWLKKQKEIKYDELPRVHFEGFEGETNFKHMKKVNLILPPGSLRRSAAKRFLSRFE